MSHHPFPQTRLSLTPAHAGWPSGLADLTHPPRTLEVAGQLPDWSVAVAIVGTRHSDDFGRAFTRELAGELAAAGCVIVSGGALGIDTAAHEGALDAGGISVAVLPTGLAEPYPTKNRDLFERIVEHGCLLSEVSGTIPGYDCAFLERNRIIAALAQVVVVTQAPFKSGAMSTAAHARRLGRPILAVPHHPWSGRGEGCLELLAQGARICRTAGDVLSLAAPRRAEGPLQRPRRPKKAKKFQGLDEDQSALVRVLGGGPLDTDELCEATGLPAPRVQRAVLLLLLSKVIQEVGGGRYRRTGHP